MPDALSVSKAADNSITTRVNTAHAPEWFWSKSGWRTHDWDKAGAGAGDLMQALQRKHCTEDAVMRKHAVIALRLESVWGKRL